MLQAGARPGNAPECGGDVMAFIRRCPFTQQQERQAGQLRIQLMEKQV
jgi:hypothetical protein